MKKQSILILAVMGLSLISCSKKFSDHKDTTKLTNTDSNALYKQIIAQSTEENIKKFDSKANGDYTFLKNLIISNVKKKLPLLVDEATKLINASWKGDVLYYTYEIKGLPKKLFTLTFYQTNLRNTMVSKFCADTDELKMVRSIFSNVNHSYYISGDKKPIFTTQIASSECDKK